MTLVDPRPLVAHAYQPLNGWPRAPYGAWLRTWAEAQFLDANRWRDVVYVLILLPLGILEFVVAIGLWLAGLRAARGAADRPDHPVGRVVATGGPGAGVRARRPPVRVPDRPRAGADGGRRLARADDPAPRGRPGAAVRRPDGGPAPGRRAPPRQPVRGARARGVRAAADRARPPRRRPAAPRVPGDRPRAGRGADRHGSRRREGDRRGRPGAGPARARGAPGPRPRHDAGDPRRPRARGGAGGGRRRLPRADDRDQHAGAGRAAPAGRGASRVLRRRRGPRERRQAQPGDPVRGRRPPRPVGARRRGARRRGRRRERRRRAAGWPGWATGRRPSTGRSR